MSGQNLSLYLIGDTDKVLALVGHNGWQKFNMYLHRLKRKGLINTDIVNGLIVDHEGAVGVFQGGVGCQNGVVRLDHSSGNLYIKQ
ncbi:hypothetical protein PoB_006499200 [Plakobranchus ocellatus]|uniref:Uncharacterized protein n=1 Tax=Plakobranchus ocellatus TaxID=259542 RepID=A0AAV4D2S5_9GAST|nr:hypothetical protein PoB_006499200 [Plakobranchus ocellatus]